MSNKIPHLFVGILCVCSGVTVLLLPAVTNLKALPDDYRDVKKLWRKKWLKNANYDRCSEDEEEQQRGSVSITKKKLNTRLFDKRDENWVEAANGIIVNFSDEKTDA